MMGTEFFLLGLMAYGCYVAVCNPLRYPVFMNHRVCLLLAAGAWFGGSLDSFLLTSITMNVPYCRSHRTDHFFCEITTVLRLARADTSLYETLMYICCVLMLLIPISIISTSYSLIWLTVHRMRCAEGRKKAFTTYSSHLAVVSFFYGILVLLIDLFLQIWTISRNFIRKSDERALLICPQKWKIML